MMKKVLGVAALVCLLICMLVACQHEHKWGAWNQVREASCTEDNLEVRSCKCGEEDTRSTVSAKGHTYGEWTTVKAETCTDDGKKERTCSCGAIETQVIAATGHSFGDWVVTTAATCDEGGKEERICMCGKSEVRYVAANGHSAGAWTVIKSATCTESGTEENRCIVCDAKIGERTVAAKGHQFTSKVTLKKATCTQNGQEKKTCVSCGKEETNEIKATGHSWTAATCTTAKECKKCHLTEGAALGHTIAVGLCSRCNRNIDPTLELPSLPTEYKYGYAYNGTARSKVKITNITYQFSGNSVKFSFAGEKTYDEDGALGGAPIYVKVKLIDADGYVIDDGNLSVLNLKVGEKFKNKTVSLKPPTDGSSFTVVFEDFMA